MHWDSIDWKADDPTNWNCGILKDTARRIIFHKSWNIMENSETPNTYHFSINALAQRKTMLSISEKFKTRTFQWSVNMEFHAKENVILLFLRTERSTSCAKKDLLLLHEILNMTFSFIQKIHSMNFSFLINMNFPFIQSSCFCNNFFLSLKLMFPLIF